MTTAESDMDLEGLREQVRELLAGRRYRAVAKLAEEVHPSDLADLVEGLTDEERVLMVSALPADLASRTLAEMDAGGDRAELLAALRPDKRAQLLLQLADDDAVDLIGELEPEEQQQVLEGLPESVTFRGLLEHDEETAGGLMTTEFVAVDAALTAVEALEQVRLQGKRVEDFYTVFVVDRAGRLAGTLRLDDLVIADPHEPIDTLVEEPIATVLPTTDQEDVGRLIGRYNLASIPVVDSNDVLLGRITFDDVIDVIEAEQTEDIFLMAGVGSDEKALRYTWQESVRTRVPWLFVNLFTAAAASSVVYAFSSTIENVVILAAIMPIIAGLGGNAGTQALAVTVRTIALDGGVEPVRELAAMVGRELAVGIVNGGIIGGVVALLAVFIGGDPVLGIVVLTAMWGNLVVAGFLGSFMPAMLNRLGVDPAVGSSMFVTPFTDLFGFLFLLGLASGFLL
ncbi:MAG: magnesium transporter [Gemmatimonadota bacterium]|nr:magnesium transporter [Gemmatimonadota bacterium]